MRLSEMEINYSAPNLMVICVDGRRDADIYGRVYNRQSKEPARFTSTARMLREIDAVLERLGFPQRAVEDRNFKKHGREAAAAGREKRDETDMRKRDMGQTQLNDMVLEESGSDATFVVHIQYRQNATWQGRVIWAEKKQSCNFRSALELLKLIDSALDESSGEGGQPE